MRQCFGNLVNPEASFTFLCIRRPDSQFPAYNISVAQYRKVVL